MRLRSATGPVNVMVVDKAAEEGPSAGPPPPLLGPDGEALDPPLPGPASSQEALPAFANQGQTSLSMSQGSFALYSPSSGLLSSGMWGVQRCPMSCSASPRRRPSETTSSTSTWARASTTSSHPRTPNSPTSLPLTSASCT